ncbi:MAG: sigma-70 family RNA polymerase sigma factor [Lachnospiraceae bacterium]|nr:sigma-70 family RNA polymerase sigma factor [Lachnospiraceae bacterium]
MKCMSCGAQIPDDADFCTSCGERQEFNKTLIDGAMRGDTQAETKLYNATYNHVYALIKSMIKDEDTVLDLLQDSYVKAFRSLHQLQEANKFRPWLKTIAKNRTMDYFRERKQVLFSDMTPLDDEDASAEFEDTNPDAMPDVVMDRQETARLLAEILDSLPDDQRGVISMFYYGQMSVKEIASALGLNEKTVSSRLIYGRNKIKTQVLELEKRGTKLYGLAPLPFLLFLLRKNEAHAMADVAASASLTQILRQTGQTLQMSAQEAGREAAGQTAQNAAQGGTQAAGHTANASATAAAQGTAPASFATGSAAGAAAAAGGGLGAAKIAAIVIGAVAIVGGGTTAGILAYRNAQEERAQIAAADTSTSDGVLFGAADAAQDADAAIADGMPGDEAGDLMTAGADAEDMAFSDVDTALLPVSMTEFLRDFYYYPGNFDSSAISDMDGQLLRYLVADPGFIDLSNYPGYEAPEVHQEEADPLARFYYTVAFSNGTMEKRYFNWLVYPAENIEWVARNVLNATEADIMRFREGIDTQLYAAAYYLDGKYYFNEQQIHYVRGERNVSIDYLSAETDGAIYRVTYRAATEDERAAGLEEDDNIFTAYLSEKEEDGTAYWSVISVQKHPENTRMLKPFTPLVWDVLPNGRGTAADIRQALEENPQTVSSLILNYIPYVWTYQEPVVQDDYGVNYFVSDEIETETLDRIMEAWLDLRFEYARLPVQTTAVNGMDYAGAYYENGGVHLYFCPIDGLGHRSSYTSCEYEGKDTEQDRIILRYRLVKHEPAGADENDNYEYSSEDVGYVYLYVKPADNGYGYEIQGYEKQHTD